MESRIKGASVELRVQTASSLDQKLLKLAFYILRNDGGENDVIPLILGFENLPLAVNETGNVATGLRHPVGQFLNAVGKEIRKAGSQLWKPKACLLYTSDAADE